MKTSVNHTSKIKSLCILTNLTILLLSLISVPALAHGDADHDHDAPPKKVKLIKPNIASAPIVQASKINTAPSVKPMDVIAVNNTMPNNAIPSGLTLNAKAALSLNAMRYVYSPIDGLLTIKQMLNVGDVVKKGQLLAEVKQVIAPVDIINQQQQIQVLQGQFKQESQNLKRLNLVPDLVPRKEIESTQLQLQNLQQQLQHAKKPLQQKYAIYSPSHGFVMNSSLDANKQVDAKQVLLSIANSQVANEVHASYLIGHQNIKANMRFTAHLTTMPNIALNYLGYLPQANNGILLRFAIPVNLVDDAGLWINQAVQITIFSQAK